jgi:hypothetical protein
MIVAIQIGMNQILGIYMYIIYYNGYHSDPGWTGNICKSGGIQIIEEESGVQLARMNLLHLAHTHMHMLQWDFFSRNTMNQYISILVDSDTSKSWPLPKISFFDGAMTRTRGG